MCICYLATAATAATIILFLHSWFADHALHIYCRWNIGRRYEPLLSLFLLSKNRVGVLEKKPMEIEASVIFYTQWQKCRSITLHILLKVSNIYCMIYASSVVDNPKKVNVIPTSNSCFIHSFSFMPVFFLKNHFNHWSVQQFKVANYSYWPIKTKLSKFIRIQLNNKEFPQCKPFQWCFNTMASLFVLFFSSSLKVDKKGN